MGRPQRDELDHSQRAFTESCGTAPITGAVIPITITLIASDASGGSRTLISGQENQPALQLRTFSCQ